MVNILFANHSSISSVFPIHALFWRKFTDHAKPLPYPDETVFQHAHRRNFLYCAHSHIFQIFKVQAQYPFKSEVSLKHFSKTS